MNPVNQHSVWQNDAQLITKLTQILTENQWRVEYRSEKYISKLEL